VNYNELQKSLKVPDSLITDLSGREAYFHDETIYQNRPSGLLLAENTEDIITAVKFCAVRKIPITPRGAGTGLSGGCVPSDNALLISTEKLTYLKIDPIKKLALCGPGLITKKLQDEAARYNLTYPPDPASFEESTLGGNVAENAGGLRCKRFGVTRDYILGLEIVTSDGSLLKTGLYNNNRGFNLTDLLIASEGTLGIITEITVRLVTLPGNGITFLAAFDTTEAAARTVSEIIAAGIIPNVLEYIDGDAAECANRYEKTEGIDNAAAVLLMETTDIDKKEQAEQINKICRKNRCAYIRVEDNPERAELLWRIRRNISHAAKAISKAKISEDIAVPISQFPHLVTFVSDLNRSCRLKINSYGHAGDGNLHVNLLSLDGSDEDMQVVEPTIVTLLKKALELGGTVTGEHGIGLAKREYLNLEFTPPTVAAMRKIKEVFDPLSIMNPRKLLPD